MEQLMVDLETCSPHDAYVVTLALVLVITFLVFLVLEISRQRDAYSIKAHSANYRLTLEKQRSSKLLKELKELKEKSGDSNK